MVDAGGARGVNAAVDARLHQTVDGTQVERHLHEAWKPEGARLWSTVRVVQRGADERGARLVFQQVVQPLKSAGLQTCVRVQHQQRVPISKLRGAVHASREAEIDLGADQPNRRKPRGDRTRTVVARGVVDDDDFNRRLVHHRGNPLQGELAGVERDDQDRDARRPAHSGRNLDAHQTGTGVVDSHVLLDEPRRKYQLVLLVLDTHAAVHGRLVARL